MNDQCGLNGDKFKNWIRGAKGLQYLKGGLVDLVGTVARNHRDLELQKIISVLPVNSLTQCTQCTHQNLLPEHAAFSNKRCNRKTCKQSDFKNCFGFKPRNRRRCPNGICSQMYDGIVCAHRFKNPMWKNTDPSTWCSDKAGWSFGGKCFQITQNLGKSASETDAAGLLSVVLNNIFFHEEIGLNLSRANNSFNTARALQNEIIHNTKMELQDSQLQSYIDIFINVLKDEKKLLHDEKAQDSVKKLLELKNNQIQISFIAGNVQTQGSKDTLTTEKFREKEGEKAQISILNKQHVSEQIASNELKRKWSNTEHPIEGRPEQVDFVNPFDTSGSTSAHDSHIPTDIEICQIARCIGKEYETLGRQLGLTQAEIDHINLDNPNNTVGKITDLLIKWRDKQCNNATVKKLRQAMINAGSDAETALACLQKSSVASTSP